MPVNRTSCASAAEVLLLEFEDALENGDAATASQCARDPVFKEVDRTNLASSLFAVCEHGYVQCLTLLLCTFEAKRKIHPQQIHPRFLSPFETGKNKGQAGKR